MRPQWQLWPAHVASQTCDEIIETCEKLPAVPATVSNEAEVKRNVRISKVRWATGNEKIRNFLWDYVLHANRMAFGFDVQNIAEIQYTEYHGVNKGKYEWHHDTLFERDTPFDRKLSVTVQLSDSTDYEDGNFEFELADVPTVEQLRSRGSVLVFPSYLRHRVTPVSSGIRKSLVAWFEGPRWR